MNAHLWAVDEFDVVPLGVVGCEVRHFDLGTAAFDDSLASWLRSLLATYQVLVFRNQHLDPAQQVKFSRCFGDLESSLSRRPSTHQVSSHPDVLYLSNEPGSSTSEYGLGWHSDGLAYARVPHGATILHCLACPPGVGDTLFATQYGALDAMSRRFRTLLKALFWHLPDIPHSEVPASGGLVQPLIRTHPVTGREFLFCAPGASHIQGMTRLESAGILGIVRAFQARDELIYRHEWVPGDVVVWENCALLHTRADLVDYESQGLRAMLRSATSGDFAARDSEAAQG